MSKIDVLLVTPPSRIDVYQGLSNEYAAIEPPVWSSLIANYLLKRNYNVQILDAEADNLTPEQTDKKIIYSASSSCYGIPRQYPTNEDEKIIPKYPYALTKWQAEELID